MLADALSACPVALWGDRTQQTEFWYTVYHTLFWLDLYLSGSAEGFVPPVPFTLDELDSRGLMPERVYSQEELQAYLAHCRRKCQATIEDLTDAQASRSCTFGKRLELSFVELLLYNMRHVQEHASQLNLILGQKVGSAPGWVSRARISK
jgi:DinB superfamily